MQDIRDAINSSADRIIRKTNTPENVVKRVSDCLLEKVLSRKNQHLTRQDVADIGDKLRMGSRHSYQTWLHLDCFNQLIFFLRADGVLKSPYFNIRQQVRRNLVFHLEDDRIRNLKYIDIIQDALLSFRLTPPTDISEEDDCICSFIASMVIFGKILFPRFEHALLKLKWKDISLDPVYVKVYYQGHRVFYRYFLPAPASVYLFRCILYYWKYCKKLGYEFQTSPDSYVFKSFLEQNNKSYYYGISRIFKRWSMKILEAHGVGESAGFSLSTFRRAVLIYSSIHINRELPMYPPFLLALHANETKSYCYDEHYLAAFLGKKPLIHVNDNVEEKPYRTPTNKEPHPMDSVLKEIARVRRSLSNKSDIQKRRNVSSKILEIIKTSEELFERHDYENLYLYGSWIKSMLAYRKRLTSSTVNTYASQVSNLLKAMYGKGNIIQLSKHGSLIPILSNVIQLYGSSGIIKAIKSFSDLIESEYGSSYMPPKWRSKEIRGKDVLTPKPLVLPDQVQRSLERCSPFFMTHTVRFNNLERRTREEQKMLHKAEIIYHMVNLGYYAGLRAAEFAKLRVHNVIYAGGIVLCIRAAKTKNGLRNIPFDPIVPQQYIEEFLMYLKKRRAHSNVNDLLFPDYYDKVWDTSYLSSEVSRLFVDSGIQGMEFHHLRHSFASLFLFRWFVAYYKDKVPDNISLLEHDLFQAEFIRRFRTLFISPAAEKKGSDIFPFALHVLARIIGHSGPLVTLERYIHNCDWLFYLLSKNSDNMKAVLTTQQLQKLLVQSYNSMPLIFKKRLKKEIALIDILNQQKRLITSQIKSGVIHTRDSL